MASVPNIVVKIEGADALAETIEKLAAATAKVDRAAEQVYRSARATESASKSAATARRRERGDVPERRLCDPENG